jgi:hypothetical protein
VAVDVGLAIDVHLLGLAFVAIEVSVSIGIGGVDASCITAVRSTISTCSALVSSALRSGARWVSTAVLSVSNAEVGIFRLVLDTVDCLDGVGDVGEIDEGAVPNGILVRNVAIQR